MEVKIEFIRINTVWQIYFTDYIKYMYQLKISTNKIVIRNVPISSRNMKYHFIKDTRQQNTARVTKEFWSEINYQMEQINKWFKLLQTPPICYFYMSDDVELSHGQDVVLAFVLKDTNYTRCTFDCLFRVFRPTWEFFTHLESSPLPLKGCKF